MEDQEKIIRCLEWMYSALTKGVIIKNDEAVIQALPGAIELIRKQQEQIEALEELVVIINDL